MFPRLHPFLFLATLLLANRFVLGQEADAERPKLALIDAKPLVIDPRDDEMQKLLKERYNAALGEVQYHKQAYLSGISALEDLARSSHRVVEAGLGVWTAPKDRLALLASYVELVRDNEKYAQLRVESGQASRAELHRATYERAHAQIMLLKEQRAAKVPQR